MREYGTSIAPYLVKGLKPFANMPRNAQYLEDMTGLIPRPLVAEGPPKMTYGVTDPYAATATWPFPQYFRGEHGKFIGYNKTFYRESGGAILTTDTEIEFDEISYLAQVGTAGSGNGQYNTPKGAATWAASTFYYTAITDSGNNRVQILKNNVYDSKFGSSGNDPGKFYAPCGIIVAEVSGTKHLWVVDTGNNRVQVFSSAGVYETTWGTYGSADGQFTTPKYAAYYDNEIYITDTGNNRVQVFNMSGVFQRKWTVTNPLGIYISSANVYVVSGTAAKINLYSTTGTLISSITDQLISPRDVTIYAGLIYVTDGAYVRAYTDAGKYRFSHTFTSPMGLHNDSTAGRMYVVRETDSYLTNYLSGQSNTDDLWQLATFQDAYYATNGATFRFYHGKDDADIGVSMTTKVRALCAHDGRLLLGGLSGTWFSGARWTTIMDVWRETLPPDVRANVNLAWGEHWVVWGARGGGAADYPDYLLMATIG